MSEQQPIQPDAAATPETATTPAGRTSYTRSGYQVWPLYLNDTDCNDDVLSTHHHTPQGLAEAVEHATDIANHASVGSRWGDGNHVLNDAYGAVVYEYEIRFTEVCRRVISSEKERLLSERYVLPEYDTATETGLEYFVGVASSCIAALNEWHWDVASYSPVIYEDCRPTNRAAPEWTWLREKETEEHLQLWHLAYKALEDIGRLSAEVVDELETPDVYLGRRAARAVHGVVVKLLEYRWNQTKVFLQAIPDHDTGNDRLLAAIRQAPRDIVQLSRILADLTLLSLPPIDRDRATATSRTQVE